jgi:hypothetical protein
MLLFLKKTIFHLLFGCFVCNMTAQNSTISGFVRDSISREALIGATVQTIENDGKFSNIGTITNENGYFSLSLPQSAQVNISYIGYQGLNYTLKSLPKNRKDSVFTFFLAPAANLKAVVISAEIPIQKRNEMSVLEIPMEQVRAMPRLMGEVDIMRVLQLMPGVQQGREGSSALYVRGGTPDQNLILLDDAPLYYVNHLGGFLSVFDDNAINSFKLYKGAFPARYGGRLSSVLDIRMKEGNTEKLKGNIQLGLLNAKAYLEGPIFKDKKTTFFASVRRSNIDALMWAYFKIGNNQEPSSYSMYDINTKITHRFSEKDRLSLTFYWGQDHVQTGFSQQYPSNFDNFPVKFSNRNDVEWGNTLLALRWQHVYNNKLAATTSASFTRFRHKVENQIRTTRPIDSLGNIVYNTDEQFGAFGSSVQDISLRHHLEYTINNKLKSRYGFYGILHEFEPTSRSFNSKTSNILRNGENIQRFTAPEVQVYSEQEWQIARQLSANIGAQATAYFIENTSYFSLQPRVLLNWQLHPAHSIKASAGNMQQNLHLLTNSGLGIPIDFWVPATNRVPPQSAWQYSLGWASNFKKQGVEASFEVFYKTMNGLIDYADDATFSKGTDNWQDKIDFGGKGRVYGAELLLQKKQGKWTGWLGYTFSVNERQYPKQNKGNWYPYRYDQTHALSLVAQYHISKRKSFSASWTYHTGNTATLPTAIFPSQAQGILSNNLQYLQAVNGIESLSVVYDSKNNYRLPAYHRLDIGYNYKKKTKRGYYNEFSIGLYNAYSQLNPYFVFLSPNPTDKDQLLLSKFTLFPILPSFSYGLSF